MKWKIGEGSAGDNVTRCVASRRPQVARPQRLPARAFHDVKDTMPYHRKRANWRHPVVYEEGGNIGRRTTRAAATGQKQRSSNYSSSSSLSPFGQSSGGGRSSGSGNTNTGSTNYYSVRRERDGTINNVSRSRKRVKAWIEVHRPPGPGIRFTVPTWIPVDDLTATEREKYLPPESKNQDVDEEDEEYDDDEDEDEMEESDTGENSKNFNKVGKEKPAPFETMNPVELPTAPTGRLTVAAISVLPIADERAALSSAAEVDGSSRSDLMYHSIRG